MKRLSYVLFTCLAFALVTTRSASAAGLLSPVGAAEQPLQMLNHHVEVVINNGFATTEVTQTFKNPNSQPLEAIYTCPLPTSASLSELAIQTGELTLTGEVVAKDKATQIYESEKNAGNDAALGTAEGIQRYEFKVARVPASGTVTVTYLYYQPLQIDTGVGRYVYALEEGGTDEAANSFWTRNERVEGKFSARVRIKSAWPVDDVRLPGVSGAKVQQHNEGDWQVDVELADASLDKDFLVYYRLKEELPGRVEIIPYRAAGDKPGSFMAVLTPGEDLKPLTGGADYVFVLDLSGSMAGKLATLARGTVEALGSLKPEDRFRIVGFSQDAQDITGGFVAATEANIRRFATRVRNLGTSGSTNLHEGLSMGLADLDDDRATSLILVTDGVTNTGVIEPGRFADLMAKHDVRVFGFLLGNSAHWPLMRIICDASGGFYAGVSNADDILGQIMLAKSKVTSEALHHVKLNFDGVDVFDLTDVPKKIYRGQQIVIFGRYAKPGRGELVLRASLTGQDKVYRTEFEWPAVAEQNPELERLWAMNQVEKIDIQARRGQVATDEASTAIRDLGIAYQIVTDETAMLVLGDEAFEKHGIERRNRARVAREREARTSRAKQPAKNYRVDRKKPAFRFKAPRLIRGGGALSAFDVALLGLLALALGFLGFRQRRRN